MNLNPEQDRAAHCPGSIAVIAGAGTGKTLMLVERFLYHVQHDGLSPLEVLAVTFTDKAAAELRNRIISNATGRLTADQVAELEAAPISTFHSLSARICREHPNEAKAPPEFDVLDEVEGNIWIADRLNEAMGRLPAELFRQIPYSVMNDAIHTLLENPLTAEAALKVGSAGWTDLFQACRAKALTELRESVEWKCALQTLSQFRGAPEDAREQCRQIALLAMSAIEQGSDPGSHLDGIKELSFIGGSAKRWPGGFEEVTKALKGLRERVRSAIADGMVILQIGPADEALAKILPDLYRAYRVVREYLDRAKRETGQLDFNDLEVHALSALQHKQVQDYYQQRWKALLVDECQDTNPVQTQMLRLLSGSARMTIVGDEKQAIYGFRGCSPAFFGELRQEFRDRGDSEVKLSTSYRTHQPLVEKCNGVFQSVLNNMHQPLEGFRTEACDSKACHFHAIRIDVPRGPDVGQRCRSEAAMVTRLLKQMIDDRTLVFDREDGRCRPVKPGDIAILSRKWDTLNNYEGALAAAGIPAVYMGDDNLLTTRPANDAMALLRFLADPGDNVSLAAILRSPFFAVSDRDLYRFVQKRSDVKSGWWMDLKVNPDAAFNNAIQVLTELLATRRLDPPSLLLQRANRLTGYTAILANLPGARRREADWRGIMDLVQTLEQGNQDVFIVCRRLKRIRDAKVKVPRTPLEAGNAVSLLSIHSAKGLEWPIVVCIDLSAEGSRKTPRVLMDSGLGIALTMDDEMGEKQTPALYQVMKHQRKERDNEELQRLYYVAITRARDKVILSTTEDSKGPWNFLKPALESAGIDICIETYRPEDSEHPVAPQPVPQSLPPQGLFESFGSGLVQIPVTALATYALCPRQFHYRFVQGHPGVGEGPADGRRVGTLTHLALQYKITDEDRLARFDSGASPAHVQEALDLASRFRTEKVYAPVRGCLQQCEQPVPLELKGLVLQGVIDAVGPDFVLDYKTDHIMDPKSHSVQLWAYSQASGRQHAWIAYLRHSVLHEYSGSELDEARHLAEQIARDIRSDKFPAHPSNNCQWCPYEAICADAQAP